MDMEITCMFLRSSNYRHILEALSEGEIVHFHPRRWAVCQRQVSITVQRLLFLNKVIHLGLQNAA